MRQHVRVAPRALHLNAEIYANLPGLGAYLASRILGEFGDDPDRYRDPKPARSTPTPPRSPAPPAPITIMLARYARGSSKCRAGQTSQEVHAAFHAAAPPPLQSSRPSQFSDASRWVPDEPVTRLRATPMSQVDSRRNVPPLARSPDSPLFGIPRRNLVI